MGMSLFITIGVALLTVAALYFMFVNFQRERLRVNALALHVRKLEGMIWAYNIRGGQLHRGGEESEDEHVEDAEHADDGEAQEAEHAEHGESEHGEADHAEQGAAQEPDHADYGEAQDAELPPIIFAFSSSIVPPPITSTIEVIEDSVPDVVSFDANNEKHEQSSSSCSTNESSCSSNESSSSCSSSCSTNESSCSTELEEQNQGPLPAVKKVRVYADNPENRRLGRVGKPY